MDDIIRIIKLLENSGILILIDGVGETVKYKIKNKNVDFLACY